MHVYSDRLLLSEGINSGLPVYNNSTNVDRGECFDKHADIAFSNLSTCQERRRASLVKFICIYYCHHCGYNVKDFFIICGRLYIPIQELSILTQKMTNLRIKRIEVQDQLFICQDGVKMIRHFLVRCLLWRLTEFLQPLLKQIL